MASSFKSAGTKMRTAGGAMTKGLTLPILAIGAAAVKTSLDFDHAMHQISEQAGASAGEVEKLRGKVLELGKTSIYSPKELADALFHIESVGYKGAKALHVLDSAQKLATVGNADLEQTTYALVSALDTGVKGTKSLSKTIGTMNAIIGAGDLRMEDFTAALSSGILTTAKQVGISLKEVGAGMDVLTAQGIPAQKAAQA